MISLNEMTPKRDATHVVWNILPRNETDYKDFTDEFVSGCPYGKLDRQNNFC
jgi:hypothetical protein